MILHNINILGRGSCSLTTTGQIITHVGPALRCAFPDSEEKPKVMELYFQGAHLFPGLINSHDHLDFNLYAAMGNHHYHNYMEWGSDIHYQNKEVIAPILQIPKALRLQWGIYKNVIAGVTTVVQHGETFDYDGPMINIFKDCKSLHSVALEKNWRLKLNKPFFANKPFVIHVGEGTDNYCNAEITKLLKWNLFNRKLIGVHGIAMTPAQARGFKSLIWCPDSNNFLYGQTAKISALKKQTRILLGTDATVSAHWDIWHHLRMARKTGYLTDNELVAAVGLEAAAVWGLQKTGKVEPGYYADLIVAESSSPESRQQDHFFNTCPERLLLTMCKGHITFFDHCLLDQMDRRIINNFSKISINGRLKYVLGDLPRLISVIREYYPQWVMPIQINA